MNRMWLLAGCVAALFLTALLWAKARDPFRRVGLSLRTQSGRTRAMAVLPKRLGLLSVAIFAHGSGDDITHDGGALRLIAEQGLAAVSFEYDPTNQANFDAQMEALLRWLPRQSWARSNSIAWITQSLGAQQTMSFLVRHPEIQPQVLVRLNGGWVKELDDNTELQTALTPALSHPMGEDVRATGEANRSTLDLRPLADLHVWLVHGELDEAFSVADCRRVAEWFRTNGADVRLEVFPNRPHNFGQDQGILIRAAAEFCAEQFGELRPLQINVRPTLWWYWLPAGLLCIGVAVGLLRAPVLENVRHGNRALLAIAAALGAWASAESAIHLVLPQLPASPRTLAWTRAWLVRPEWRADFDWLKKQPDAENQKIRSLLQHLELGDLQRTFFQPEAGQESYREFVLSPWIESDEKEIGWRRMLWEAFYPRIRHESDVQTAAETVARFLRERVTITDKAARGRSITENWRAGITDPEGFERIYTAALRSVGIAARLNSDRQTELFTNGRWLAAPRPLIAAVP